MLETALEVSRTVGHIFWVSALGGLATMITGAWFIATLIGLYTNYLANLKVSDGQEPDRSTGKFVGLVVFVVFSFYWLSEVIKTAMHVCVSGVYGTWFVTRSGIPYTLLTLLIGISIPATKYHLTPRSELSRGP